MNMLEIEKIKMVIMTKNDDKNIRKGWEAVLGVLTTFVQHFVHIFVAHERNYLTFTFKH